MFAFAGRLPLLCCCNKTCNILYRNLYCIKPNAYDMILYSIITIYNGSIACDNVQFTQLSAFIDSNNSVTLALAKLYNLFIILIIFFLSCTFMCVCERERESLLEVFSSFCFCLVSIYVCTTRNSGPYGKVPTNNIQSK